MLANPILVPAYAEPIVWVFALAAMCAEVHTAQWVMQRLGSDVRGLFAPLLGMNLVTWFVFLVAVDRATRWPLPEWLSITLLEVAVVLVETALLHSATRGRLFTRGLPCTELSWPRALLVSFAGNLMSVLVSVAVVMVFVRLSIWLR